ncbi:MAG: polysaccharide biosynthesis protein [Acidimicrobiia bacterium]|nr:polysaccharide biosynthesis protein [Acidimicrobiia bacterium]
MARLRADVSFALVDAVIITMAYVAGLTARFADGIADSLDWWPGFWRVLPLIVIVHLVANVAFGNYGHVWEYASVGEALRVAAASAFAGILIVSTVFVAHNAFDLRQPIPISVVILGAMFTVVGTGVVRFRSRVFSFQRMVDQTTSMRALVVGTGRPAAVLARQALNLDPPLDIVGFVDIKDGTTVRRLVGRPVWSGVDRVPDLVRTYRIEQVIVATTAPRDMLNELVDSCSSIDVALRIVPDLNALLKGEVGGGIRNIELADLLPRPTVDTDMAPVARALEGRTILVTGAGGSIGSEIVRQCLSFADTTVIALDHDETHLHDCSPSWEGTGRPPRLEISDIRDVPALEQVFERHQPDVVFHAAAHKHVPILERCPEEAVKTNIVGTANVIEAAKRTHVERFVLISTDKAVDPSSVMGASKRVAEMLTQAAAQQADTGVYTAVRFGNVLWSRGSVVPTFMRQISDGGPVTITDPRMTRYFMTVPEAVQLVLQSAAMSHGGEVFVLDMGEAVRILDLANRLIRLSGLVPGRDIEIRSIGMRPGEKLQEVLSDGPLGPSDHPKISKAALGLPDAEMVDAEVHRLSKLATAGDRIEVEATLHGLARHGARRLMGDRDIPRSVAR